MRMTWFQTLNLDIGNCVEYTLRVRVYQSVINFSERSLRYCSQGSNLCRSFERVAVGEKTQSRYRPAMLSFARRVCNIT